MQPIVRKRTLKTKDFTLGITVSFYGKSTAQERESILSEILSTITEQTIFWSDTRLCNWSFDYKLPCGAWCENIYWNNELSVVHCSIY